MNVPFDSYMRRIGQYEVKLGGVLVLKVGHLLIAGNEVVEGVRAVLPRPLSHTHFLRNGACAGMPGCPDNPFRKKLKVYFLGGDQIARFLIDFCMFEGFFRANCPI